MPNRWIEFVKKWASDNNTTYGCALSKPEMKAEYHKQYPKKIKLPKGVKKLEESRPPADVKSKVTYPNLKIRIPEEQENIQFEMEDMGEEPAKAKRGRPQKYATKEEQYKAKLESNKQKRREKAAAKKIAGSGQGHTAKIAPTEAENQARIIEERLNKKKKKDQVRELSRLTDTGKLRAEPFNKLFHELDATQKGDYTDLRIKKNNLNPKKKAAAKKIAGTGNFFVRDRQPRANQVIPEAFASLIPIPIAQAQVMPEPEIPLAMQLESKKIIKKRNKKLRGGTLNGDAVIRGQIEHMGFNIKNLINQKGISKEDKQNENRQSASNAFELLNKLKNPTLQEIAIMNVGKSGIKGTFIDSVMDLPNYYKNNDITINRK